LSLVRRMDCVRFAVPLCTEPIPVARLRGLVVFRVLQVTQAVRRPFGGHGRTRIGPRVTDGVPPCPDEILFIVMPGDVSIATYLELRRRRGWVTVVDVTADVLGLITQDDYSDEMREAAKHNAPGAGEWWSRPESQDALVRSLRAAHVVTTSWEDLVSPLCDLIGQDGCVFHLPDLRPNRESHRRFVNTWKTVITTARRVAIEDNARDA